MDMKRFFLFAIAIAALTLAGCGGGGGGGTDMTGGGDTMPPAPTQCPDGQVGTPPNCAPAPCLKKWHWRTRGTLPWRPT